MHSNLKQSGHSYINITNIRHIQMNPDLCYRCGFPIYDTYLVKGILNDSWHQNCLKPTPYGVYSTVNGFRYERNKIPTPRVRICCRCKEPLLPLEIGSSMGNSHFHSSCYRCEQCGQYLLGTKGATLVNGQLICTFHIMKQDVPAETLGSNITHGDVKEEHRNIFGKYSGGRTCTRLTKEQKKAMMDTFRSTQKPTKKIIEALSIELKLSKKSLRTWFNNKRAEPKRVQRKALLKRRHEEKMNKTKITPEQKVNLEAAFENILYPTKETLEELAKDNNLPFHYVRKWFYDKRYITKTFNKIRE